VENPFFSLHWASSPSSISSKRSAVSVAPCELDFTQLPRCPGQNNADSSSESPEARLDMLMQQLFLSIQNIRQQLTRVKRFVSILRYLPANVSAGAKSPPLAFDRA